VEGGEEKRCLECTSFRTHGRDEEETLAAPRTVAGGHKFSRQEEGGKKCLTWDSGRKTNIGGKKEAASAARMGKVPASVRGSSASKRRSLLFPSPKGRRENNNEKGNPGSRNSSDEKKRPVNPRHSSKNILRRRKCERSCL